ncbi:hypothetical protein MTR_6g024105 [Medicago truncatula]|uniref:Uncharacterized protein n=1 Tax=Medicago truncatula TaxID=3880 RepID=A0A072U6U5_MEDTR|nr:hypothetical protein MTR_6g024105 [Medicago truncatula]
MNPDEDHDEHNNILKYFSLPRISSESEQGCKVQDLRSYLKHHSGKSHKTVRSGLTHIGGTNINFCPLMTHPVTEMDKTVTKLQLKYRTYIVEYDT